jgi:hypothetical protein
MQSFAAAGIAAEPRRQPRLLSGLVSLSLGRFHSGAGLFVCQAKPRAGSRAIAVAENYEQPRPEPPGGADDIVGPRFGPRFAAA